MTNIDKNCRTCKHYKNQKCNIMLKRMMAYKEDISWPDEVSKAEIEKIKENVQAIIGEPSAFYCSEWE